MNPYPIIAALLIGAASIVGSFFYGKHVESEQRDAQAVSANADYFAQQVKHALAVNDTFAGIGRWLSGAQAATQSEAVIRTVTIDRVIHEKPLPAICVIDPELIRLRCESRAALYRAAGQPVPGECPRDPATAASPAGDHPGG